VHRAIGLTTSVHNHTWARFSPSVLLSKPRHYCLIASIDCPDRLTSLPELVSHWPLSLCHLNPAPLCTKHQHYHFTTSPFILKYLQLPWHFTPSLNTSYIYFQQIFHSSSLKSLSIEIRASSYLRPTPSAFTGPFLLFSTSHHRIVARNQPLLLHFP
jgi:hypothetical protein